MVFMNTALPLAERLRPKRLEEYVGQKHLTQPPDGLLWRIIQKGIPRSLLFWGPPGCGKTSLAKLYLKSFSLPIETLSTTTSATQDFRRIIDKVSESPLLYKPTFVWVDEVHRLTRPQQDILLQSLEDGSLILVAATTENPSFQLAPALLSRCQVMTLTPLETSDLAQLLARIPLPLTEEAKAALCEWAQGDARMLLNWLDQIAFTSACTSSEPLSVENLAQSICKKRPAADPTGEGRYNLISALHKAVRGSDCQAALYWFCRQCTAGEDLRYIARRLIRMASEDIGLADPHALGIALNGLQAYETLGSPEGDLALAQVVIYLALAPKSNAAYTAFQKAKPVAEKSSHYPPPAHLVNAVTSWMKREGFGAGYLYDHDFQDAYSGQRYFPDALQPEEFYHPVERGFERELTKRLAYFSKLQKRLEAEDQS
jgi:putative ATPase